jgi:hypothetical protein
MGYHQQWQRQHLADGMPPFFPVHNRLAQFYSRQMSRDFARPPDTTQCDKIKVPQSFSDFMGRIGVEHARQNTIIT